MNDEYTLTTFASSKPGKKSIERTSRIIAEHTNADRDNPERFLHFCIYETDKGKYIMTTFAEKPGHDPLIDYFVYRNLDDLAARLTATKMHTRLLAQVGKTPGRPNDFRH